MLNSLFDRVCERHWIAGCLDDKRHEREWYLRDGFIDLLRALLIQAGLLGVANNSDDLPPRLRSVRYVDAFAERVFVWKEARDETFTDHSNPPCSLAVRACEIPPPLQG